MLATVWLGICRMDLTFKHEARTVESETGMTCPSDREIAHAIRKLASGKSAEIASARTTFLKASSQSSACRTEIIEALIKAMDRPNLDFNRDTDSYYLWRFGADLLGDLRAAEALDLLISHLTQRSAFFSSSMNHQPALRGVIKMGSIAVPKLAEVLRHNSDPKRRYSAIYCIATMGGVSAIAVLREALVSEADPYAKRLIQASLESFDAKDRSRIEWSGLPPLPAMVCLLSLECSPAGPAKPPEVQERRAITSLYEWRCKTWENQRVHQKTAR